MTLDVGKMDELRAMLAGDRLSAPTRAKAERAMAMAEAQQRHQDRPLTMQSPKGR